MGGGGLCRALVFTAAGCPVRLCRACPSPVLQRAHGGGDNLIGIVKLALGEIATLSADNTLYILKKKVAESVTNRSS